ncbi:transposase [Marinobacter sp. R17]|uniref:Mu transposase C-terminal domain-containing protein n=1 Tax=Marinobacter sp. R17 TaxID=2484250 RepID=UPI000F4D2058|nr:Mu transposase C-terminal domain-containing protein [Marinobacter sp. R17]ROT94733.1 transposase [Marinobacter sp. R17]
MNSHFRPGQLVYWRNQAAIILELQGLSDAIIRTVENSQTEVARTTDLTRNPTSEKPLASYHLLASDKDWDKAVARYEVIRPLLEMTSREKNDVDAVAEKAGKSTATIYRWIRRFEETGLVSSLLRSARADKGTSKLPDETEELIARCIDQYYLRQERPSVLGLFRQIKLACYEDDIPAPTKSTVYSRVYGIEERERLRRRYSPKRASEKLEPLRGKFPGGKFPNEVVQIDHTPVDLIVVDQEHRLPVGRPYLTIALDVATKMITGFRMTLEAPGASSAGLCVAHAALAKEHWLAKRDIHAEWPIYGKMNKIHVDNAKEFRGKMLRRACKEHGITLEHRPKGQPNYGPHVERAFRTFMQEAQNLPGTTFSNVQERFTYDSEGKACMTLDELETWFTVFIVYCYHHRSHAGINDYPPIKLYHEFVHGNADTPGIGLPAPVDNEEKFRLDFTPYLERTVQRQGVVIDNIHYFSPVLRKWVGAAEAKGTSKKRKFIFARDPRDISVVYFFDPDTKTYCPLPYLNSTRPAISIWELRAAQKLLRERAIQHVDEEMIFKGIKEMRRIEQQAIEKTRLAKKQRASEKRKRRMAERRTQWQDIHTIEERPAETPTIEAFDDEPIEAFNDIQLSEY